MSKIGYGLIGFGGIAENRIAKEGFALDTERFTPFEDAVLIGATDVNRNRSGAARDLGLKWYLDSAALLADPAIDAVVVATNNLTHAPLTRQALQANKHVLVEKPLAPNSQEIRGLIRLADEKKLSLAVDHMMVYNKLNRKAGELIDDGALGEVNDACFHMQFAYGFDPVEAASWRCSKPDEMGGPIGDVASHCFYVAEDLLKSRIEAVRAVYYPKRMNIEVEDGALIQCDLENGITFSVIVSFSDMRGGLGGTLSNLGYEIYGSQAVLRSYGTMFQLSGHEGEPCKMRLELDTFEKQHYFTIGEPENIYQGVIAEHARSIIDGEPLSGFDALRNVLICEAAHKSAINGGKTVAIKE